MCTVTNFSIHALLALQKLVDELPIDITATTFVEPDEASLFDLFLPSYTHPSPVSHNWSSSTPELVHNIYAAIDEAQRHQCLNSDYRHLSEPHLAIRPHPAKTALVGSSLSRLSLPSWQWTAPICKDTVYDSSRNVPRYILDLPNHDMEYVLL